jgi:hypothetical protein
MDESFPSTTDPLTAATQFVKNGRLEQAKEVLTRYLMQNPTSEQGWLLMSFVLVNAAQQKDCLERVLRINPNNTVAQSRLAHLLGKRTEELFQGKGRPPSPPPPKTAAPLEPVSQYAPLSEPPASESAFERVQPAALQSSTPIIPEPSPSEGRKSVFSGRWFWIITIVLTILILGIVATILYFGVIAPALSHLSITVTPTPSVVIVPTLPPAWTITLTPTKTLTPIFTSTPTVTPTPTVTQTNTKTAGKKP